MPTIQGVYLSVFTFILLPTNLCVRYKNKFVDESDSLAARLWQGFAWSCVILVDVCAWLSFRLTRILSLAILEIRFGIVNEADGYVTGTYHLVIAFVHQFVTMILAFVQFFLLFFIHARV